MAAVGKYFSIEILSVTINGCMEDLKRDSFEMWSQNGQFQYFEPDKTFEDET